MSKIGKNIRKIRATKGLSQTAFANLFNLTRASIGAYEEGRAEPKTDTTLQIAKHFSIPVEALLSEELTVNRLTNFNLKSALSPTHLSNEKQLLFVNKDNWNAFINDQLPFKDFAQNYPKGFLTGELAIEIHAQINTHLTAGTIITCSPTTITSDGHLYLYVTDKKSIIGSPTDLEESTPSKGKLFVIHQKIEPFMNASKNSIESRLLHVESQLEEILKKENPST